MKKILIITQNYPPFIKGGAEISTSLMVSKMKDFYSFKVITCNYSKTNWEYENIEVIPLLVDMYKNKETFKNKISHYLDMFGYHYLNYIYVSRYIKKLNPDVIQCVFGAHYFFPTILAAIYSNKPVVIDVRDHLFNTLKYKKENPVKTMIFLYEKLCSDYYIFTIKHLFKFKNIHIITISEYLKKELIDNGFLPDRISVLQNLMPEIRKTNRIIKKSKYFIFAGRLTEEKGLWTMIKAFEQINNEYKLLIAGDGPEKIKLCNYIENNNIKSIRYIGKLNNNEVLDLYLKAYAILAPSIWNEPYGRFIQESYATLTPCIATKVGGIPEGIKDKETGLIVPPGDSQALKNAINTLINNKSLYKHIVLNLKNNQEKFNKNRIIQKRIDIYNSLIS